MTCLHLADNVHFPLPRSGCHRARTSNFDTTLIKKTKNRKDTRYLFRYQGKKGQKVMSTQNRTVFFFFQYQPAHTAGAEKVPKHKPTATFAVTLSSAQPRVENLVVDVFLCESLFIYFYSSGTFNTIKCRY